MIGLLNKDNFWLQNIPNDSVDLFDLSIYNISTPYTQDTFLLKPRLDNNTYIEGATPQEIYDYEDNKFPFEISRRQLRLQWQLDGRELTEIDDLLEQMPEITEQDKINKITAKNAWTESIIFLRKDYLMQVLGIELLGSRQALNDFFNRANNL